MGVVSGPDGARGVLAAAPARPERARARAVAAVAVIVAAGSLLTACGASTKSGSSANTNAGETADKTTTVAVVLTNDGCAPEPASVTPGKITFEVQNKDATKVTEGELKSGDLKHILAEKENLTPGLGADFTLNLEAGEYKVYCPGAKQDTWDFTVKGAQTTASWKSNPQLVAAVNGYAAWIKQEVAKFAANTQAFAAAIKAGNVEEAKALYAKARLGYESVEPVAEAFGDLDHDIDGRIDDFPQKSQFQGFHRLE